MPDASITAISSRATNGNVTNIVASTMPGTAKMILMSCSNSHGPNQPCLPKSWTKISPATTGDTANGKSMSVVSRRLPRKSNRVIAHAAAMPKTALAGTVSGGDEERQPDRRERLRRLDRLDVRLPSVAERFDEDEGEGDKEENRRENASATVVSATRTSTGSVSARRAGRASWPNAT